MRTDELILLINRVEGTAQRRRNILCIYSQVLFEGGIEVDIPGKFTMMCTRSSEVSGKFEDSLFASDNIECELSSSVSNWVAKSAIGRDMLWRMRSLASNLASLTDFFNLIISLRMLTSSSFEILTVKNMFRLSPRRWQRSDRSGMTELKTGAWISAQDQHKSGKSLRSAPVGLRTKMWTCSSSRASRKIEAIFFTECSFVLVS